MSTTVTTPPIVTCLVGAEEILGPNRIWQPQNHTQQQFLEAIFAATRDELDIPEIETIVSWSAEEINRFLRKQGFSIQLEPLDPDTFGVASVLDLLVEWLVEGIKEDIDAPDGKIYPGVRMEDKAVGFFTAPSHPNPVAQIYTKSGDRVFMTMIDDPPVGFNLITYVEELVSEMKPNYEFGGLVFPMVDLDQEVDIAWLIDMATTQEGSGRRVRITQALQQTKLKMNENGTRVKSAATIAVTLEIAMMPKPDHIVDRPFLIWIEREGLSKPLFVGHITPEDWKDPGSLDM